MIHSIKASKEIEDVYRKVENYWQPHHWSRSNWLLHRFYCYWFI